MKNHRIRSVVTAGLLALVSVGATGATGALHAGDEESKLTPVENAKKAFAEK